MAIIHAWLPSNMINRVEFNLATKHRELANNRANDLPIDSIVHLSCL